MKRLFVSLLLAVAARASAAQTRDSSMYLPLYAPRFSLNIPADYVPLFAGSLGGNSGLPYLFLSNAFRFDSTTNTAKSVEWLTNNVGTGTLADPCFTEQQATVLNKGVSSANCHVIYIPALAGTFGSTNALQVQATASHVRNASGQGAGKLNATGALDTCRQITTLGQCWGNTVVSEDTAGVNGILQGIEVDINLQGTFANYTGAAANPTGYRATMIQGGATFGSIGTAFNAQKLTTSKGVWSVAFGSADSGASTWGQMGAVGTQASQNSQTLVGCYRDGAATSICRNVLDIDFLGNENLARGLGGATNGFSTNINNSQLIVIAGATKGTPVALTCGAATTPALDPRSGNFFSCNITANAAVTVAVPSVNPSATQSQTIYVALRNSSGGALTTAPTFNTGAGGFKFSGSCNPATGTECLWTFTFDPTQAFWYMVGGTPTGL